MEQLLIAGAYGICLNPDPAESLATLQLLLFLEKQSCRVAGFELCARLFCCSEKERRAWQRKWNWSKKGLLLCDTGNGILVIGSGSAVTEWGLQKKKNGKSVTALEAAGYIRKTQKLEKQRNRKQDRFSEKMYFWTL